VALTAAVEMAISLGLLIAVALCFGVGPSAAWLLLPFPLLALMLLGFGMGLAVGTWCAFLPDVGEVVPVVLRVSMWLVPVVLPFAVYADHGFGWVVSALPPTPALFAVREILIGGRVPGPLEWALMAAWAAAACALGGAVLERLRPELRDVL
jgi:lipopolysaccharide transport system permease protein